MPAPKKPDANDIIQQLASQAKLSKSLSDNQSVTRYYHTVEIGLRQVRSGEEDLSATLFVYEEEAGGSLFLNRRARIGNARTRSSSTSCC